MRNILKIDKKGFKMLTTLINKIKKYFRQKNDHINKIDSIMDNIELKSNVDIMKSSEKSHHIFKIGRKKLLVLDKKHELYPMTNGGFSLTFKDSLIGGKKAILTSTSEIDFPHNDSQSFNFEINESLIPFASDQFPYYLIFDENKVLTTVTYFSDSSFGSLRKDITQPIVIHFYPNGKIEQLCYLLIDNDFEHLVDYTVTRSWLTPSKVFYNEDGTINKDHSFYRVFNDTDVNHSTVLSFKNYDTLLKKLKIKGSPKTNRDKLKLELYFNFEKHQNSIVDIVKSRKDLYDISDENIDLIEMIIF